MVVSGHVKMRRQCESSIVSSLATGSFSRVGVWVEEVNIFLLRWDGHDCWRIHVAAFASGAIMLNTVSASTV